MKKHETLLATLTEQNPEALLFEPRSSFDKAVVDVTDSPRDHWPRETRTMVAVYQGEDLVDAMMDDQGCDSSAAMEWISFNMAGAWGGEGTPVVQWHDDGGW